MADAPRPPRGNFVAEWFGHRVWPTVASGPQVVIDQSARRCTFLSNATGDERLCVKTSRPGEPSGVCTISSDSNGVRQDWLACPYRTLDQDFSLLRNAVRTLYRINTDVDVLIVPVTALRHEEARRAVSAAVASGNQRAFAFAADKLGGEVDIPETIGSPGGKVDVSIVEIRAVDKDSGEPTEFGSHLMYEIQTSDFHGSPLHAVRALETLSPRGQGRDFHDELRRQVGISGTNVEGPNKANVFKRTVYQLIYKAELADVESCAGLVLVIPVSVWASWLRHLGYPTIWTSADDVTLSALAAPGEDAEGLANSARVWILVFDVDRDAPETPQPLQIVHRIATSPAALKYQTFEAASERAIGDGVIDRYRTVLSSRVLTNWRGG